MPSERLTWDGVALHAGDLPGYPSSHGCVHLPSEFARLLFGITRTGMTVVIAKRGTAPVDVVHPPGLVPVDAKSGAAAEEPRLSASEAFRWEPEKAPAGPVTLLLSAADQRVLVVRNGVEIGRARITIDRPETPLGTHAFTAAATDDGKPRWIAVAIPGHGTDAGRPLDPADRARVSRPGPAAPRAGHHHASDRRPGPRGDDGSRDDCCDGGPAAGRMSRSSTGRGRFASRSRG
jgi:hypothetical protein